MINAFGILKCSMHLCNFVIISALFRFRIIVKLGFYVSMLALTFKDLPKYESVFFLSCRHWPLHCIVFQAMVLFNQCHCVSRGHVSVTGGLWPLIPHFLCESEHQFPSKSTLMRTINAEQTQSDSIIIFCLYNRTSSWLI